MIYFDTLKTANEPTTAGMDARQAKTLINIFLRDYLKISTLKK